MAKLLSDVDINLAVDGRGEIIVHTSNRELVKNAVGVVLGTIKGEVPFLPQLGTSLYLQNFNFQKDTFGSLSALGHDIESQVPGALVAGVEAVPNPLTRELALNVGIQYEGEGGVIDVLSDMQISQDEGEYR